MKRFKLKEPFPTGPEVGTIFVTRKIDSNSTEDTTYIEEGDKYSRSYKNLDKYPHLWEEVVEDSFEIISIMFAGALYYKTDKVTIMNKIPIYKSANGTITTIKEASRIRSIKRNSDGTVITVGDVFWDSTRSAIGIVVTSIEVDKGYEGGAKIMLDCGTTLSVTNEFFKTSKQFLFTSYEGVNIFEGDTWWYVKLNNLTIRKTNTTKYVGTPNSRKHVERFSTEAAAKSFVKHFYMFANGIV